MTILSTFILGLYVFLQSGQYLGWFDVDAKLLGIVGVAFVIVLVVEAVLGHSGNLPRFLKRNEA